MASQASDSGKAPKLRRALGLWDLVFCGIILVQPTAAMPIYGVVSQVARGHVATTILIATVAMLFTAVSYGRMARIYPNAGSAFTYVGREIHATLGYITGWSLTLDYLLAPMVCTIWCSKAAGNILPQIPYALWVVFFVAVFTSLNLRGIKASARTNEWLVAAMSGVILVMLVAFVRYLLRLPDLRGVDFIRPIYDPSTFSFRTIFTGTSVAALTYIGFDGVTTLSEEAKNPRRNILLATVLTCIITAVLATIQAYAAQLVWPDFAHYPDVDTAYVHVAGRAGGAVLFQVVNFTLLVASLGAGIGAQLAAGRLLYGMGRDNAIPRSFFGFIEPKNQIPRNNILFTGAIALAGASVFSYQLAAELVNFGAFIAFMGVNAAAFVHYWLRAKERNWDTFLTPVLGFLICLSIWLSLRWPAKLAGAVWVTLGIIYAAIKTKGFRLGTLQFVEPTD
jgi:amino acid transporter